MSSTNAVQPRITAALMSHNVATHLDVTIYIIMQPAALRKLKSIKIIKK
jgi:hypothetical protein